MIGSVTMSLLEYEKFRKRNHEQDQTVKAYERRVQELEACCASKDASLETLNETIAQIEAERDGWHTVAIAQGVRVEELEADRLVANTYTNTPLDFDTQAFLSVVNTGRPA